ncbi:hypothetical protein CA606_20370 [Caulobacter vibrioides]|uniref:Uncharacterized protein n=1 Tax=Caulobacter vibrioides TaxID=155892 RepID=A0A2S1B7P9_CAUVI|nr:hypothetical protein CA606_20370 [Caulobacter vibrioides]
MRKACAERLILRCARLSAPRRTQGRPLRHAAAPRATSPAMRVRRKLSPPAPLAGEVARRIAP